jgi:phosphoribosyl 1,2-cyclic phosphodiesterase
MRLTFWGTRGSIPSPGRETVRYGGNTPCLELRLANDELIILDAGTGIKNLGEALAARNEPVDTHLLISHPHWDHIQGFPFFKPNFVPGTRLTIVGYETEQVSLQKVVSDLMNKVYFPVHLDELKATLGFRNVGEESFEIAGAHVQTILLNHPSFAVGYRISQGGKSIVYISDNEPFDYRVATAMQGVDSAIIDAYGRTDGDPNRRVFEFAKDADVLIHDATYTPEEYQSKIGWGHSHYMFTLKVAAQANVRRLILFHHEPSHSDEMIDGIVAACRREIAQRQYRFECSAAAEGMEIRL